MQCWCVILVAANTHLICYSQVTEVFQANLFLISLTEIFIYVQAEFQSGQLNAASL